MISFGRVKRFPVGQHTQGVQCVDIPHGDLAGGRQSPEQHGRGFRFRQDGLCHDATLELGVQAFDGICGAGRSLLACRLAGEGEEPVSGFLRASRHGRARLPPLAQERLLPTLGLVGGVGIDHVPVVGESLQPFRHMPKQVALLVEGAVLRGRRRGRGSRPSG